MSIDSSSFSRACCFPSGSLEQWDCESLRRKSSSTKLPMRSNVADCSRIHRLFHEPPSGRTARQPRMVPFPSTLLGRLPGLTAHLGLSKIPLFLRPTVGKRPSFSTPKLAASSEIETCGFSLPGFSSSSARERHLSLTWAPSFTHCTRRQLNTPIHSTLRRPMSPSWPSVPPLPAC